MNDSKVSTIKNLSSIGVFIGLLSFVELFSNIITGRYLSPDDFGKLKFVTALIGLFGILYVLGQEFVLIRKLSASRLVLCNWRKHAAKLFFVNISLVGITSIFLVWIFKFNYLGQLFIGMFGFSFINLLTDVIRSKGNFFLASLLKKMGSLVFLTGIIFFVMLEKLTAETAINLYAISIISTLIAVLFFCSRIPNGTQIISFQDSVIGIYIFFISSSYLILKFADKIVIAKVLSFSDVGGYSAVVTLSQGYGIVAAGFFYYLLPKYKEKATHIREIFFFLIIVCCAISGIYLFFGKILLSFLFKGKYDDYHHLLYWLMIVGCTYVINVIPGSFIGLQAPTHMLKNFLIFNLILVVIFLVTLYFSIRWYGVIGAAVTAAFINSIRLFYGLILSLIIGVHDDEFKKAPT